MRRFAVDRERIHDDRVTFDRAETRHLARVLRLRPGDIVIATDGRGNDYTVRLDALGAGAVGTILGVTHGAPESPIPITLIQGIPKSDKMDTIVRAATELGVARIVPAVTARTVTLGEGGRPHQRAVRWQRVAREAAKQCGRAVVPDIAAPVPLAEALRGAASAPLRICLYEGTRRPLGRVLTAAGAPTSIAILIGAEGGLDPKEIGQVEEHRWTVVGFGPRILRTETAGPALLAVLQARFGDLLEERSVS